MENKYSVRPNIPYVKLHTLGTQATHRSLSLRWSSLSCPKHGGFRDGRKATNAEAGQEPSPWQALAPEGWTLRAPRPAARDAPPFSRRFSFACVCSAWDALLLGGAKKGGLTKEGVEMFKVLSFVAFEDADISSGCVATRRMKERRYFCALWISRWRSGPFVRSPRSPPSRRSSTAC